MQPRIDETCIEIPGLLSETDTREWIRFALARGYRAAKTAYPPSYRNNDRLVIDDEDRAEALFERIAEHLPQSFTDDDGTVWELSGLNPRIRLCRYRPGQWFGIHRDGAHHDGPGRRSFLTVMAYLNGTEEFEGGTTRFFATRCPDDGLSQEVSPQRGTVVVFSHRLWHDGAPVTDGVKYIMRSDVMYERRGVAQADGHLGYVWSIAALPESQTRFATGGRDKTLRIWDGDRCVDVVRGHHLSVSAVAAVNSRLWSGSRDGHIIVWSRGDWRQTLNIQAHDGAVIALCPVGCDRVASAGADGVVAQWTETGAPLSRERRHRTWVWCVTDAGGGRVLSGSEDGFLSDGARRVDTGRPVRALAKTARGFVSGDADGIVSLWDDSLELVTEWEGHRGAITAIVELPHGDVATASEDGWVRVWHLPSRRCVQSWRHDDFASCLAVRGDGALLSGSYDGSIQIRFSRR